jgi:hypothetical protein
MKSKTFRRKFGEKPTNQAPKVALLLVALALPALAIADRPIITLAPFPAAGFVVPAGAACDFDVFVKPQEGKPNKERLIEFANTSILAGPLFVTLRNESTQKTVSINISGSNHVSISGATLTATGSSIWPLGPDILTPAGLPLLPLFNGRLVLKIDQQGNVTAIASYTGAPVQDVCQMLGS